MRAYNIAQQRTLTLITRLHQMQLVATPAKLTARAAQRLQACIHAPKFFSLEFGRCRSDSYMSISCDMFVQGHSWSKRAGRSKQNNKTTKNTEKAANQTMRSITLQLLISFPMKLGVCTALRWQLGILVSRVCDAFRVSSLSAPSAGGVAGIETATTFLLTTIYSDDSVHGDLLDKLI